MARRPISGLLPQFAKNAGGASASGYWLKLYEPNTTTHIPMYTLQSGGSTLVKCVLNSRGETISNVLDDDSTFIPYVDEDFDAYLFFTAADADANNTTNAIFLGQSIVSELVGAPEMPGYVEAQFATVATMIAGTALNLPDPVIWATYVGRTVKTVANNTTSNAGGAEYLITTTNPGSLSTLVGGMWAGANHSLGGGYYAELYSPELTPERFGAEFVSDDSAAFQALLTYCNTFGTAEIGDKGSLIGKKTLYCRDVNFDHANIIGNDNKIRAATGAAYVLRQEASGYWDYTELTGLRIDGNSRASNGVTFLNPFGGRLIFDRLKIEQCHKAIEKPSGNIGNTYRDLSVAYCDYGLYCTSVSLPTLMHSGADILHHGHFGHCDLAAIYIDSSASGTGQFILDGTIVENNAGFGLFVENFQGAGNPLELRNVWFEDNHSSASVVINGTEYTPKDLYLKNVSQGHIFGTVIQSVYIENSDITIDTGKTFSTYDFQAVNSKIRFRNCVITGDMAFTDCDVMSYDSDIGGGYITDITVVTAKTLRDGLRLSQSGQMVAVSSKTVPGGVFVASYDGMRPFSTLVPNFADGGIFPCSLNGTASGAGRIDGYSFSVTANSYYYIKCELKLGASSALPQCYVQGTGTVISDDFSSLLRAGEWVTVHLIGRATNTGSVGFWLNANGGSIDVNFGACTVVRVINFRQIHQFYNNGSHVMQNGDYRFYSATLPATVIGASHGDEIIKTNPSADGSGMMLVGWKYDGSVWREQYSSIVSPAV